MDPRRIGTALLMLLGIITAARAEDPAQRAIDDFQLSDFRGKEHRLADYDETKLVVVAFLGTECPLAKLYGPRLSQLADEYKTRGVQFLGINSNRQDSITELAAYARIHGIGYPLLKDPGNRVADRFGAERTPEVFVLDRERRIAYRGRIDDQFGVGYVRDEPREHFLREALEDLLAERSVRRPQTEVVGCHIGRVTEPAAESAVTWSNQIARIFQKHCVECHRQGDIAPFALTEYDGVAGWGPTIAEVIRDQRMPPWHANLAHGSFRNERLMPAGEKQLVYDWVEAGCPEGDPSELPEPRRFSTGWQLPREPDRIIAMRDHRFAVPAEGVVEYQYFVVDPQFEEDKWVAAAEIIPGNRAVVHHAIVFVRPPDEAGFRGVGWLAAYVPGQRVEQLEAGLARRVPAGSKLVFQMHYTPNGSEQQDLTRLGIVFADPEAVREEAVTLLALNQSFEIPPHASDHRVDAVLDRFPTDGRLLALVPHMHLRGKAFRVEAELPDGTTETLLDVPHYDFNWQTTYVLSEPRAFPPKTQLRCIARFDNSAANLNNPDPSVPVRWGDQTWQEMALGYFAVAVPLDEPDAEPEPSDDVPPEVVKEADATARRLLAELDADGDGIVRRDETPVSFATFGFGRYDEDGDGALTLEELTEATKKSLERKRRRERQ